LLKPKCCGGSIGSGTGSYSTGNCIGKRFKMFVKNYYPPAPLASGKVKFCLFQYLRVLFVKGVEPISSVKKKYFIVKTMSDGSKSKVGYLSTKYMISEVGIVGLI